MSKTIFYSWQSDLPNNKNRGFIQNCIELAIKEINKEGLIFEVAFDRDTREVYGTPHIADTIFDKIENCDIFIADVSIINQHDAGRKTPNPNVLLELGYAAKKVGWGNVLCIFNTEFGKVEDLPFDLRFRRPVMYNVSATENKANNKKAFVESIKKHLLALLESQEKYDAIEYHYKEEIDAEILHLCGHFLKLIYKYEQPPSATALIDLMNLPLIEIQKNLFETNFLGFSVLKDYSRELDKFSSILNSPFFTHHAKEEYKIALLNVIDCLKFFILKSKSNVFSDDSRRVGGFRLVDAHEINEDNPKHTYWLKRYDDKNEELGIFDWGVILKYNLSRTVQLQRIKNEYFNEYTGVMHLLLNSFKDWGVATKKGWIFDPARWHAFNS